MSRDDLMTLLAIASGHAPPCPSSTYDDASEDWATPTPDEWAAHLMAHAKALGRAVDAELDRRAPVSEDTESRLVAAWKRSGMPLGKLLIGATNEYAIGAAVSMHGLDDVALVEMAERFADDLAQRST